MNIAKNMEAIFVAALAFAGSTSFVAAALPAAQARDQVQVASAAVPAGVPVVVVTAKRLTPAEKLAMNGALPRSRG